MQLPRYGRVYIAVPLEHYIVICIKQYFCRMYLPQSQNKKKIDFVCLKIYTAIKEENIHQRNEWEVGGERFPVLFTDESFYQYFKIIGRIIDYMQINRLNELMELHKTDELSFEGPCHDCRKEIVVTVKADEAYFNITGGAVYEPEENKYFLKCDDCFQKDPVLKSFQECEVYSRIVGYLRPVKQWNPGKVEEFKSRTMFDIKTAAK